MCNSAVLVAILPLRVKVPKVGARTFKFSTEVGKGKEEEKEKLCEEEEEEDVKEVQVRETTISDKVLCFLQTTERKTFPVSLEGVGKTVVIKIAPQMSVEELEQLVKTRLSLPNGSFFLSLSRKVLDSVRMSSLTRDVSVRVHFRSRGGMMRVPRHATTVE